MSFKKTLYKNIMVFGGYTYGSSVISFLASTITLRLLSPADVGFVALITVFTGFITIFADAGIGFAIIRSDYGRTFHNAVNTLSFWIGVALFLLMVVLAYPIALFYEDLRLILPTIILSSLFVIRSLSIVPSAILTKNMDFNFLGQRRFIINVSTNILTIALAFTGISYWALIIPQILTAIMGYLMIDRKVKLGFKLYPFHYTKAAFSKTKSLMGNITGFNLINYWARNADNLLVGKIYGAADLGIYSRAYSLLTLPLYSITGLFSGVLLPSLQKLQSMGGDTRKEYGSVLGIISIITFPIAAVLVLVPQPLVNLLWGEKWTAVGVLLPYFGLLILTQTLVSTSGRYFILLGKEAMSFRIGSITAVALVLFIFAGAYFSVLDVARFYTIGYLTVGLFLNLYFGFYKTIGFSGKFMLSFWGPKVAISFGLFFSILFENMLVSSLLFVALLIHVCYIQRHDFSKGLAWASLKIAHMRGN